MLQSCTEVGFRGEGLNALGVSAMALIRGREPVGDNVPSRWSTGPAKGWFAMGQGRSAYESLAREQGDEPDEDRAGNANRGPRRLSPVLSGLRRDERCGTSCSE